MVVVSGYAKFYTILHTLGVLHAHEVVIPWASIWYLAHENKNISEIMKGKIAL